MGFVMRLKRVAAGLVATVSGLCILAVPAAAHAAGAPQGTVVNAVPAAYTPDVNDGTVFAIGQSGSTVVVGGTFTSVSPHSGTTSYPVTNLAAFTVGTGALVTSFAPTVNGQVTSIVAGPTSGTVYVGGSFTLIDGVKSKLALISTTTGALVPGWKSPAINGAVNSLALLGNQLFVGGLFTAVANTAQVGLAVLNATTGALTGYSTPTFTGHHNYGRFCNPASSKCANAGVGIKAMDISPDGTRLIAIGNFSSVSGSDRDQIALIDLGVSAATLDPSWSTLAYTAPCNPGSFDSYMRDVEFSPDGSYFVVVATGGGFGSRNSDGTLSSCDAATRFETTGTGTNVRPTWIDYTGNDTFLSVATTGTAVYVGGHERWVNNSTASDHAGEGAVPRPGIVALDPTNGMPLSWNPGRNPRGTGAHALLATSDGLYVGSDTNYIGDSHYLHKKVAFFPLVGGETLASNAAASLPGTVYLLGSGSSASTAQAVPWDGSATPVTPSPVTAVDWSTTRAAFEINNTVYTASTDGNFYERSFDGTTFGPAVAIDPYDDPLWDNVQTGSGQTYRGVKSTFYSEMSSLTSMFYSAGRLYYTRSGSSHMFWRWFEPDSGVVGADEFTTTDTLNWSNIAGAFLSGSTLYFADGFTKAMFAVPFNGGQASGTPTMVNSSINWASHGAFVAQGPINLPPVAAFSANCDALTCSFDASASRDPDGSIASYSWSWGDTTSTQDTQPLETHTYPDAEPFSVTLTVTDNGGATNSTTETVNPTTNAVAPITFQGVSTYDGSGANPSLLVPAAAQPGDQLLLYASWASATVTATPPAGWTLLGTATKSSLSTAVYQRTAQLGDASSAVPVAFSASVKGSLTLADYASTAPSIEAFASHSDTSTSSHTCAALTGLSNGSLALTYWTDKSTGTTAWTPPATVVQRSVVVGSGGGAISALLTDSGNPVSGSYGPLTASTNATTGAGVEWSIALTTS
jgi:PKD repeat protein